MYTEGLLPKKTYDRLEAVVFNITNRCNLSCLHCFNGSPREFSGIKELNDDKVIEIVDQCIDMGVGNVCFSGGEPFTRRSLLLKCLKMLGQSNIRTSIVSNGTLIDFNLAQTLKALGLAEIEISLDGIREETHERLRCVKGSFQKALASIIYLVDAGITTSISFTLTSWNGDEFAQMVERLGGIGVYGIYVRPLMVMGSAVENSSLLVPDSKQYRKIAKEIRKLKEGKNNVQMYISDPLNHIIFSRSMDSNPSVEIQADGRLQCSYCIKLSYGSLLRHSLREYWEAGLARAWKIPAVADIASEIYCYQDLSETVKSTPDIGKGFFSSFDIVDDAGDIWGQKEA